MKACVIINSEQQYHWFSINTQDFSCPVANIRVLWPIRLIVWLFVTRLALFLIESNWVHTMCKVQYNRPVYETPKSDGSLCGSSPKYSTCPETQPGKLVCITDPMSLADWMCCVEGRH